MGRGDTWVMFEPGHAKADEIATVATRHPAEIHERTSLDTDKAVEASPDLAMPPEVQMRRENVDWESKKLCKQHTSSGREQTHIWCGRGAGGRDGDESGLHCIDLYGVQVYDVLYGA